MINNGTDEGSESAFVAKCARLDAFKDLEKLWVDVVVTIELNGSAIASH